MLTAEPEDGPGLGAPISDEKPSVTGDVATRSPVASGSAIYEDSRGPLPARACQPGNTCAKPGLGDWLLLAEGLDVKFKLKVNGQTADVEAPEEMPLLWALRDSLDLKGTKFGCGIAQCGACTVSSTARPSAPASPPSRRSATTSITTIEGLSPTATIPLQARVGGD